MCNACGFACCALDTFDGCGCDGCHNSKCWETCEECGGVSQFDECTCDDWDEYDDWMESANG